MILGLVPRRDVREVLVRSAFVLLFAVLAALIAIVRIEAIAPPHLAGVDDRSYSLPRATVVLTPRADGSVDVTERIEFAFNGYFSGAYRDIPLRTGDVVRDVVVCEQLDDVATEVPALTFPGEHVVTVDPRCPPGSTRYTSGASTTLGSGGASSTFGTELVEEGGRKLQRIVWHYSASSERRAFTLAYRVDGLIERPRGESGDGTLVLAFTPWGDTWGASLDDLEVFLVSPRQVDRGQVAAFASSRGARTTVASSDDLQDESKPVVTARDVSKGEPVELLLTLPPGSVGSDAVVATGDRTLDQRLDAAKSSARESDVREQRWEWISINAIRGPLLAALAAALLAGLYIALVVRHVFRELPIEDVPEFLDAPPEDLPPALAASMLEQEQGATSRALVATVMDLVRRDAWKVLPAAAGRHGARVDIALKLPGGTAVDRAAQSQWKAFELPALALVDTIVADREEGVATGSFGARIRSSSAMSAKVAARRSEFESLVRREVADGGWLWSSRTKLLALPLLVVSIAAPALLIASFVLGGMAQPAHAAVASLAFAAVATWWLPLVLTARSGRLMTRWTSAARPRAARWWAYRAWLDRFGDMEDETVASIELWERHLVYAVAFGCAVDVIRAVRPEGADASNVSTAMTSFDGGMVASFSSGLGATYTPPSSSSGSSGGSSSFSGGSSFGGGGGGGGGAW